MSYAAVWQAALDPNARCEKWSLTQNSFIAQGLKIKNTKTKFQPRLKKDKIPSLGEKIKKILNKGTQTTTQQRTKQHGDLKYTQTW